ncbi:MAG: acyltransferase family protein [Puniceicoccales bacterium]
MSKALQYRPEIDGLRAVAVLPVVFYHVGLSFPGGFIGVDVFFVISGFLITGIIMRELELGNFSIMRFYERRVRRILPALTMVLLGTLAVAYFTFFATEFEELGQHIVPVSIFLENLKLYTLGGDYWAESTERLPLLHMWSLAIEEQFYIFIPVLLIVLHRFWRRHILLFFVLLYLASLACCIVVTGIDTKFAFYMLPTRAWELASGSLVFILISQGRTLSKTVGNQVLSILGILMILVGCFIINDDRQFPGAWALIPTLGASLFIYGCTGVPTLAGRLLSCAPMRLIGLISYSLYLIHWPLLVFVKNYRFPEPLLPLDKVMIVVVSILLSLASWKFVETPFRRLGRHRLTSPAVVAIGCAVLALFFVLGKYIRQWDGMPERFDSLKPDLARNIAHSDWVSLTGARKYGNSRYYETGGYQLRTSPDQPPQVVLFGDSHATMFAPAIDTVTTELGLPTSFCANDGQKTYIEDTDEQREMMNQLLDQWHPKVIIYICRWEDLLKNSDEQARAEIFARLEELASRCDQLYVFNEIPRIFDIKRIRASDYIYGIARKNGWELPTISDQSTSLSNDVVRSELESLGANNIELVDACSLYTEEGSVVYHDDEGYLYYRDDSHLNAIGAEKITPLLRSLLVETFSEVDGGTPPAGAR